MAEVDPLDHDGNGRKGGAKKKPETLTVFLDYDTWLLKNPGAPEDEQVFDRIKADPEEPQALPYERARELLREGKARRADPLPGED